MVVGCSRVLVFIFAAAFLFTLAVGDRYDISEPGLKMDVDVMAEKKSTNLGSRMCRWDSRNCGTYNKMRKKSDKGWVTLNDLRQRGIDAYTLANVLRGKAFFNEALDADNEYKFYK